MTSLKHFETWWQRGSHRHTTHAKQEHVDIVWTAELEGVSFQRFAICQPARQQEFRCMYEWHEACMQAEAAAVMLHIA